MRPALALGVLLLLASAPSSMGADPFPAWSTTDEPGAYTVLPPLRATIPVALPLEEGGAALTGTASVDAVVFLPDVPFGTRVPVIADVGPYYGEGYPDAIEPAPRLGKFLIDNFVPHGYAVAQVSVLGTGRSTHCMDLMGRAEQAGIDAAVTWLGAQAWSSGSVGLIGRSYDGGTAWEAAMTGNPALKTIVPISGVVGMPELTFRNGSMEMRGLDMQAGVYGPYSIDGGPQDADVLCPDLLASPAEGARAHATADPSSAYWRERSFLDAVVENYDGSVYLVHGLQDWNVDPHVLVPTVARLQDAGIETRGLFGQWGHMYPDRASEHQFMPPGRGKEAFPASVRLDWAQDLLEWFDHELKAQGPDPALAFEVQDATGAWRVEATYPPEATWRTIPLATASWRGGAAPLMTSAGTPVPSWVIPAPSATAPTRIAGLPHLHLSVTPLGPGGQVYATLTDAATGRHLGHAIMDLRHADASGTPRPVVPGVPIVARMEFEPLDVVIPPGRAMRLTLAQTGEDYLETATPASILIDPGASALRLPIVPT